MSKDNGPKVSTKMRKGIKLCEELLGIKYSGKTFDDAKAFLDEHLPEIQGMDIRERREPSDKQLSGIAWIERETGEKFTGHNQKEASEFISRNIDKCKKTGGKK